MKNFEGIEKMKQNSSKSASVWREGMSWAHKGLRDPSVSVETEEERLFKREKLAEL